MTQVLNKYNVVVRKDNFGYSIDVRSSLISSHTSSYFRAFIIFCLLITISFFAKKNGLLPDLSGLASGDTIIYLPFILLASATLLFFIFSLVADFVRDT